jgi:hypothetical protein
MYILIEYINEVIAMIAAINAIIISIYSFISDTYYVIRHQP